MSESSGRLTMFFDDPFWVGVFERVEDDRIAACKVTFGAELRDCEVWSFVLKNYDQLRFSPWVTETVREKAVNPKRVQRELRKRSRHRNKSAAGIAAAAGGDRSGRKSGVSRAPNGRTAASVRTEAAETKRKAPGQVMN